MTIVRVSGTVQPTESDAAEPPTMSTIKEQLPDQERMAQAPVIGSQHPDGSRTGYGDALARGGVSGGGLRRRVACS